VARKKEEKFRSPYQRLEDPSLEKKRTFHAEKMRPDGPSVRRGAFGGAEEKKGHIEHAPWRNVELLKKGKDFTSP